MEFTLFLLFAALSMPTWVALVDLLVYLSRGRFYVDNIILFLCGAAAFIVYPALYITLNTENNCCDVSAAFAKGHVVSIVAIIICYVAAYIYSMLRKKIFSPVAEVCANAFLIAGLALNIIVAIHTESSVYAALGNLPGFLLIINMLIKNHIFLLREINPDTTLPANVLERVAIRILYLPAFKKLPVLMVLCLPLLAILWRFCYCSGKSQIRLYLHLRKPTNMVLASWILNVIMYSAVAITCAA